MKINDVEIEPVNMVLIVGANGTGKTRLLDEIHSSFSNRQRESNFWQLSFEQVINDGDKKAWYENLHQYIDNKETRWYCPFTQPDGLRLTDAQHQNFNAESRDLSFLNKELTHYLPVAARLNIPSSTQIASQSQVASDQLNILFRSQKMFREIQGNLRRLFNKELHLTTTVPNIELRLSDSSDPKPPTWILNNPHESYIKYQRWLDGNKIGNITIEGHGIQAFLHIMLSYALPTNFILMIDEPEIHLYPSIKRKFGLLLGNLAQKGKKQFICVTHDSDFLQGVFDAKCDLDILKLSKTNKEHKVIHTAYSAASSLWAKHNQTSFLQLAFLDCGILVEGATDRLAYEYIFSDQKLLNNYEYKFISCGGNDSISNPEKIAQDLNVPYAIILDIDNLKEGEYKHVERILKLKGQDTILANLRDLGPKLAGIKDFRQKGIDAINDEHLKEEVQNNILELESFGIFIVPCGCLESWQEIDCLKAEFPEKFIRAYRRQKNKFNNIIVFLKKIETYLLNSM